MGEMADEFIDDMIMGGAGEAYLQDEDGSRHRRRRSRRNEMPKNDRERAWTKLRQLRDFARTHVGRTTEISDRMVRVLDEAVAVFQNDPPCPMCGSEPVPVPPSRPGLGETCRTCGRLYGTDPDDDIPC